jgi:hypothetical protein
MIPSSPAPQTFESVARARRPRRNRGVLAATGAVAAVALAIVAGWLLWPTPPGPAVLHGGTARYVVTATVDSPRIGAAAVDIDLTTRTGDPAPPVAVDVEAVMPLMGHATPPVAAVPVGGGRYRAEGVPLMMTGPWQLRISMTAADGIDHLMLPLSVSG